MKRLILLILFLFLIKLSYSQPIYPRILLINNDTVICISEVQVKNINKMYEYSRLLSDENIQLSKTLTNYSLLSNKKDSLLREQTKIADRFSKELAESVKNNGILSNKNAELVESIDRRNKVLKKACITSFCVGAVVMFILK